MNANIKKLWIEELRSGRWEQYHTGLRDPENGRCCLGVLCEVYQRETGKGEWIRNTEFKTLRDRSMCFLPEPIPQWSELNSDKGDLVTNELGRRCSLTTHNDGMPHCGNILEIKPASFDEIATMIDEQL